MKRCLLIAALLCIAAATTPEHPINLPAGSAGIGFDDLRFSERLGKVLVPGGRTGKLFLIDAKDQSVNMISGFSSAKEYSGGHGEGITSVDEGGGLLYASDRSALKLDVIDLNSNTVVASTDLASSPDYVRYVNPTHEVWVTQPGKERIEVFELSANKKGAPAHAGFIPVPGGPESLIVDQTRGLAYTHLWKGKTVSIDLKLHKAGDTWSNGCEGSRGIALNEAKGFLFTGCSEGQATTVDLAHDKKLISRIATGAGVDIIAYNSKLARLYVPGGKSATMAIVSVSNAGQLSMLRTVPTALDAHCVAADSAGNAYVCDPQHGRLLLIPK